MPLSLEGSDLGLRRSSGARAPLAVGLVNLMPDAALEATERQFAARLAEAAADVDVRLHLFTLPGVARGPGATEIMAGRYGDLATLEASRLDALIVTGAEPLTERLEDEAYWSALTRVVDWAEHNTVSTIWSCLAAHAAVLHLDGITRSPLPQKRFGLYECVAASPDPLLARAPSTMRVPHSRWNDLDESRLRRHGYRIVSRSLEAGIDTFAKSWRSQFIFLQGHPEYDPDTLHREFRRDVRRYLCGDRDTLPGLPRHYYDQPTEQRLAAFLDRAGRERSPDLWPRYPADWTLRPALATMWRATATQFFANWLVTVAAASN